MTNNIIPADLAGEIQKLKKEMDIFLNIYRNTVLSHIFLQIKIILKGMMIKRFPERLDFYLKKFFTVNTRFLMNLQPRIV